MFNAIAGRVKSLLRPDRLKVRLPESGAMTPGLYHFTRDADGFLSRFHLRVEPDGSGLLVANASAVCRLSASGVFMAHAMLNGETAAAIVPQLARQFRNVSGERVRADYAALHSLISSLAQPGVNYPVTNLDDPWATPHARQLSAPLSADISVPPGEAEMAPLLGVLHALWEAGIPQACMRVPPHLSAETLIRLVERAEDLGMIAGVRIRATDVMRGDLLQSLAQAGVDYIVVPYISDAEASERIFGTGELGKSREAFVAIAAAEVCPVAMVPLIRSTGFDLDDAVKSLVDMGVTDLSFFAVATLPDGAEDEEALAADALPQVAALVEETAHEHTVRFIWEPPVERDPGKALAEQVLEGPRCAGDAAVRIEFDGSVIPPRGHYRVAGNILCQPWADIWNHEAFRVYRERVEAPTRCHACPGLALCAADCPRNPEGWATGGAT